MKGMHFCHYCRCHKPEAGFKFVIHKGTLSKRRQCADCQAVRKLPRAELERRAAVEVAARSKQISETTKAALDKKRKEAP